MPVIGRTCIERLPLAPAFVRAAYLRVGERPQEFTRGDFGRGNLAVLL
jgi:hypothetical protein